MMVTRGMALYIGGKNIQYILVTRGKNGPAPSHLRHERIVCTGLMLLALGSDIDAGIKQEP